MHMQNLPETGHICKWLISGVLWGVLVAFFFNSWPLLTMSPNSGGALYTAHKDSKCVLESESARDWREGTEFILSWNKFGHTEAISHDSFMSDAAQVYRYLIPPGICGSWAPNSLTGLNSSHLFLIVLEAKKSKIKVPTDSISGELSSWLADSGLLGERGEL